MRSADDARTLRARHAGLADALDRLPPDDAGTSAAILARTVAVSSYPTAAGRVYGVQALDLDVAETEGATPTLTVVGSTFYALNLGANVPALGTNVLLDLVGTRWTFVY